MNKKIKNKIKTLLLGALILGTYEFLIMNYLFMWIKL